MTNEEIKKLNIYEKLNLITDEIGVIEKSLKIDVTKTRSYKAVSERDVLDNVKPLEKKYRVFSYPVNREVIDKDTLTKESDYGTTNSLYMRVKTTYRFVNLDNTNDYVETIVFGDGIDTGDKAPGKAMTYADKYALMKTYKLSTGDDPDKEASPSTGYTKQKSDFNLGEPVQTVKVNPKEKEQKKLELEELIIKTNSNRDIILDAYQVKDMGDLSMTQLNQAVDRLKQRVGK